jgi:hypothetical protein
MSVKVPKLAYPFAASIALGTVDNKLDNFTFETFVIDVLKFVSFGATVRTVFDGHFEEGSGQTRPAVVLTTAHNEVGIAKRLGAYLTGEAIGNLVDEIVVVATTLVRVLRLSRHDRPLSN